jgi:hypothetical protein
MKAMEFHSQKTGKVVSMSPSTFNDEQSKVIIKTKTQIIVDYIYNNLLTLVECGKSYTFYYTLGDKRDEDGNPFVNCAAIG